ncbi:hypothetical protein [Halorarum salinum]|uniref:Uncharacterized protein n=1 Tax=Halorarum salinum TaxID=2743089 RepID=A0A7D5QA02_9EURY|nr:hypothetical protein [Halobaculum salinum]QLG62037.1 hypothetical protein HUG12_09990 [Halobaculum salinum]
MMRRFALVGIGIFLAAMAVSTVLSWPLAPGEWWMMLVGAAAFTVFALLTVWWHIESRSLPPRLQQGLSMLLVAGMVVWGGWELFTRPSLPIALVTGFWLVIGGVGVWPELRRLRATG